MVMCDIAEDGTGEMQTGNAFLHHGMAAHLHESILAAGIHHLAQQ